jgi:hypothetical protein
VIAPLLVLGVVLALLIVAMIWLIVGLQEAEPCIPPDCPPVADCHDDVWQGTSWTPATANTTGFDAYLEFHPDRELEVPPDAVTEIP